MTVVITYGTYDLLHYGHIRLLKRAKALGDYLIVGVTSDDFDKTRGKINVQQPLEERVEAVKATGIPDKVIIEEYEGQKIDDIKRYDVDIFTVGSDWIGHFDYLNEYCKVVYLDRTQGVSSSQIRDETDSIKLGLVGYAGYLNKVFSESKFVNGIHVDGLCTVPGNFLPDLKSKIEFSTTDYDEMLNRIDAVYIHSHPSCHYEQIKKALRSNKHVLCESPIALNVEECVELTELATRKNCILMESLRTAYSVAYMRMLLLLKGGKIGDVISVDATCTSLSTNSQGINDELKWNGITAWGPTALLPIFQILGTDYQSIHIISQCEENNPTFDTFSKVDFIYPKAVASVKVGTGAKSEGELIISGTKGYIYVPAPWWKTDYFEIRYENPADNRRYFYQLDGEGIRYELVSFIKAIKGRKRANEIESSITYAIAKVMEDFYMGNNKTYI